MLLQNYDFSSTSNFFHCSHYSWAYMGVVIESVLNTYKRVLQLNVQKWTRKLGWYLCSQPWAIVALITNAYQYWSMQAAGNHVWCILGRWWLQHLSVFFGEIDLDMLYSCSIVFSSISWPSRRRRHISKSMHHPTGDILAILNVHHSWVELFFRESSHSRHILSKWPLLERNVFSAPKPPTFTHHNILIITPHIIIILKAPPGALSGIKCQDNCFFCSPHLGARFYSTSSHNVAAKPLFNFLHRPEKSSLPSCWLFSWKISCAHGAG